MGQKNYQRDVATTQKLLINYKPMSNSSGATSDGITFATDGRPSTWKDKSNIACFQCGVPGHYSSKNTCKQDGINKYNATNKVNETRNTIPYADNDKRSMDTPVEETGT